MRLQAESAVHSLFLINRKQGLDRSVTQAIVRQHGHRQSGAHAIVRPQSRLTGRHPITVYVSVDRIFLEIMLYGRVFGEPYPDETAMSRSYDLPFRA